MSDTTAETAPTVAPADLRRSISAGEPVSILDLRDREEAGTWRTEGETVTVRQAPMMRFVAAEANGTVADLGLREPVIVVCGAGDVSDHVAGLLNDAGLEVRNLAGGIEAWADLYVAADIEPGEAIIRQYHRPSSGCLSYPIASDGEAVVVDPPWAFVDRYVENAVSPSPPPSTRTSTPTTSAGSATSRRRRGPDRRSGGHLRSRAVVRGGDGRGRRGDQGGRDVRRGPARARTHHRDEGLQPR